MADAARGGVLRNEGVPALPVRPEGAAPLSPSLPASPTPPPPLAIPPPGVENPSFPEDEDDGRGSRRSAGLLLFLAGVASGDGVVGGRVDKLLDPLEEIDRCRGRRPLGNALLFELDEGFPATISRRRGDDVPLSARNRQTDTCNANEPRQKAKTTANHSAFVGGKLHTSALLSDVRTAHPLDALFSGAR